MIVQVSSVAYTFVGAYMAYHESLAGVGISVALSLACYIYGKLKEREAREKVDAMLARPIVPDEQ